MSDRAQRRLAAIVAADVAGYSRLVGADEEGTLAALRAHRVELIDPLLEQHGGRVANTAGDSYLLEFPSAVDALRCAMAVQTGMVERNTSVPPDRQIQFRVGINVGDVVTEGEDLLGDGVNVAARLEGLAEPGGICLSRAARDQVRDRLELTLEDLGEVEVKNIVRPVRVFRVVGEGVPAAPRRLGWKPAVSRIAAAAVVVLAIGAVAWLASSTWRPSDDPVAGLSPPSVAVLPFRNLSTDRQYDALADGLALEVSDRLAKVKYMRAVGRSSMSGIDLKEINPVQIRKSMDTPVDYFLASSIQVDDKRVRIFAELLSAKDGRQVWSKSYDGGLPLQNLFEFQENVALGIVTGISGGYGILAQIDRKRIDRAAGRVLNDYECTLLTFLMWENGAAAPAHLDARNCWERFLEENKDHADALGWLAAIYYFEKSNNINVKPKPFERMRYAAEKAVAVDPKSQIANYGNTISYFGMKREVEFLAAAKKTISLDPDNISINTSIGFFLHRGGHKDLAVPLFKRAIRFDPFPPFWYVLPLYEDAFVNEDYERALELSLAYDLPDFVWTYVRRAQYYAALGNKEKAAENAARIVEMEPDFAETFPDQLRTWEPDPKIRNRVLRLLRAAGINVSKEGS